jgi:26S proteasome regulatory subunit N1
MQEGPSAIEDEAQREELTTIMSNSKRSERFLALARDLDVMEPKTPDDVYKMHLVEGRATTGEGPTRGGLETCVAYWRVLEAEKL